MRKKQLPCALEIKVVGIRATKTKHITEKTVVLLLELVSPDGETIKILQDTYHHTETWELQEGDKLTIGDLSYKVEIND